MAIVSFSFLSSTKPRTATLTWEKKHGTMLCGKKSCLYEPTVNIVQGAAAPVFNYFVHINILDCPIVLLNVLGTCLTRLRGCFCVNRGSETAVCLGYRCQVANIYCLSV